MTKRNVIQLDPGAVTKTIGGPEAPIGSDRDAEKKVAELSECKRDVSRLIAREGSNGEIGKPLFIPEGRVKTHISRILGHLDLRHKMQLATFVYPNQLFGLVT